MSDPTSPEGGWTIADRMLPACTVRIHVGPSGAEQSHSGTGFFVAPGVIVTCKHVLKSSVSPFRVVEPSEVTAVRVDLETGSDSQQYSVLDIPDISDDHDLAVIRVEGGDDQVCALLIGGLRSGDLRSGDRLHTFGYPARHPEGVPTKLKSEGLSGARELKFADGQVQPGMSGSPILNRRTRGVCAVLSRTRDEGQGLGGYAVPIERLFDLSPKLRTDNERFHVLNQDWYNVLPLTEKDRIAQRTTGPGGVRAASLFVVSVAQKRGRWVVSSTEYPGGRETGPRRIDLMAVRDDVARLFRYWARRGRPDPGDEVERLGKTLGAVLPGDVKSRLDELLVSSNGPVEVALRFEEQSFQEQAEREILYLPWEYLCLRRNTATAAVYLAPDDRLAFVRTVAKEPRADDQPAHGRLSVLLVGVDPDRATSSARPDDDDEARPSCVTIACDAVQEAVAQAEPLDVRYEEAPTAMELDEAMKPEMYNVVHYVGFGEFSSGEDKLALGGRKFAYVGAASFSGSLNGVPSLVVLQLCPGINDEVPPDLSAFAHDLLDTGVKAVVAYQFPVPGRLSTFFTKEFYAQIAAGAPVAMAVQAARRKMWMGNQRNRAFLSPAIFVRQPGELRLLGDTRDSSKRSRAGVQAAGA
jgi:CHAT domain/Trypsin-like peptidase domain